MDLVKGEQKRIRRDVEEVVKVNATLDPANGRCARRSATFGESSSVSIIVMALSWRTWPE